MQCSHRCHTFGWLSQTVRIDLLFLRSSCMFMKWETDFFFLNRILFLKLLYFHANFCFFFLLFLFLSISSLSMVWERSEKQQINWVCRVMTWCDRLKHDHVANLLYNTLFSGTKHAKRVNTKMVSVVSGWLFIYLFIYLYFDRIIYIINDNIHY